MSDQTRNPNRLENMHVLVIASLATLGVLVVLWPTPAWNTLQFVTMGLVSIAPLVIPGVVLVAWIVASGADAPVARAFEGRTWQSVVVAAAIGAVTPVCGVTVLPMMVGLLAAGIPLAPVMAFWLASPITDPAMLATTIATLGLGFALGKTIAAFGLGLYGGAITALFARRRWARAPLRQNRIVGRLSVRRCHSPLSFDARVWKDAARRGVFRQNAAATSRLMLICLVPAFAAEYALNASLQPGVLASYLGEDVWWAVPVAVLVGAPAYLDGYAALPLTRGLIEHGMSDGAAMAFLVAGGVVSIWGAMAIFPVLRLKPFLLYLAIAVSGSTIAGYGFGWIKGSM